MSATEYRGKVRIKLGAVQLNYTGTVTVREADEAARRVVLAAQGTEMRGAGTVAGTFTTTLTATAPDATEVTVVSEVNIAGRVTGFGRGIMQDVANRLIRDFASCLEEKIRAGEGEEDNSPTEAHGSGARALTVRSNRPTPERHPR